MTMLKMYLTEITNLLCTPGNDVESTTGLAGSGANIILFTTGHDYVEKRAKNDPQIRIFYDRLEYYEENLAEMRTLSNVVYDFDVRKYESETETLDAIKEMYDILGIKGYDREKLAIYYNEGYNKIEEIKKVIVESTDISICLFSSLIFFFLILLQFAQIVNMFSFDLFAGFKSL